MFAIAWFFAGLLPLYLFLFYRPHMGLIMQDNQIYFSSIGFFVLIGILFNGLRERHTGKIFSILILCAIFAFYIAQANRNNRLWKDQKTYCSYWSKYVPGCDIAVFNLASEHAKEKDYKKALLLYRQCLLGTTDDYEVYLNVGNIYMDSGLIEKASSFFEAALKVNPASWEAYNNLGVLYMKKRDPDNAQKSFMAALDLMPETERRGYLMKWAKLSEEAGYGGLSRLFREKAVSGT